MSKKLVIVESPMKARTIKKFLPKDFFVEASMGHVRDLPQSASDIPEKLRKEDWAKLGVNVAQDFEPLYIVPKGKSKIIANLRKLLKESDELYLATDEDREGESISWHLLQLLNPKVPVKRMVFHEITKTAIQAALKNTRSVDAQLVSSQETRRILDRLVGYTLSPLLWKKIAFGLSAGRVQSAGVRLLVERERERMDFKQSIYWDLKAKLEKEKKAFEAKLLSVKGKKLATGKDFEPTTGKPLSDVLVMTQKEAEACLKDIEKSAWTVLDVEQKEFNAKPFPPFITSTLQQEANRKLGLSAKQAMRTAQSLYEKGLITYMRTDSPQLSEQAIAGARGAVEKLYGKEFLSPQIRQFASKTKAAQEAHEAIRPTGDEFLHPKDTELDPQEFALYDLIWKRTVASQMKEALKSSMSVKISAADTVFGASGMKIIFPGFLRAYVEGSDDPESALDDQETLLPDLKKGDTLKLLELQTQEHETKPVARYTEASLVQRLEKEGIGRPSTYANIIGTILDRDYARKAGNALVPTYTAFVVVQLLEKHFSELVDYKFTSTMEDVLDEIAEGKKESLPYLKEFYLGKMGLKIQVDKKEAQVDPDESRQVKLQSLQNVEVRVGRFGPYVIKKDKNAKVTKGETGEEVRASIPEGIAPSELTIEKINEIIEASEKGPTSLGIDPQTKLPIYVLLGRFGPYLQLGQTPAIPPGLSKKELKDLPKPKRASIPASVDYRTITLEQAIKFVKIPYEVGKHPTTNLPIMANVGRFGPYLSCGDENRSVKKDDDIYAITLARAVEILAAEKGASRRSKVLKDLGTHPSQKKPIQLMDGKYGPYIKCGTKNYKLPEGETPETFDEKKAIALINSK